MKQDNIICGYWGIVCATILSAVYFLWVSELSSHGKADKNLLFYIGGCAIYFVIYFIVEEILLKWFKTNLKSIQCVSVIAMGAALIWMIYSYVKDPELFPVGASPIHDFPIVLHFTLLVGMIIISNTVIDCDLETRNKKIRNAIVIIAVTLQTALLYAPNVFLDTGGEIYHIHAYVNSIVNILSGQPFDNSNSSIYGHYALFYGIPVKIVHAIFGVSNLTSIILMICLVGVIAYIVVFYLLDKMIRSNIVYFISVIAFTAISTFCYGTGQYYQVLPHRILFQVLALYGAWHSIYVRRKRALLWIICACSVIWNIEIGLICCVADFVLNIWFDIDKNKKNSKAGVYVVKNFIIMMTEFTGAYLAVNIYNLCNGGMWNSVKTFIFPLANSNYLLGDLPAAIPDVFAGYFLEIILFMGMLCYSVTRLIHSKAEECNEINRKYIFMIFNSLMGLGCLTYYMNRAARANLYISHVELIVLLAVCADIKISSGTFRFNKFSSDAIKRMVRQFAVIFLVSMVLDSVGHAGMAIQSRMQTTWNTDSIEEICGAIQAEVPEGTIGFGTGVPELYSALNRETGVYIGDWSDYGLFDMSGIDDIMAISDRIFANKASFEMNRNYVDFVCSQSYEISGISFGLFVRNEKQPVDGNLFITPKQNSALGVTTDGNAIFLGENHSSIVLTEHVLVFENNMVLDVPGGVVNEAGKVQLWERNDTDMQRWRLEESGDCYMICWHDYALTYDLNDNSIRLMPITGGDNQLWMMNILE